MKKKQGVRLGRPRSVGDDVVERVRDQRAEGRSLRAIASGLKNDDEVPTGHGGAAWHASTIRALLGADESGRVPVGSSSPK